MNEAKERGERGSALAGWGWIELRKLEVGWGWQNRSLPTRVAFFLSTNTDSGSRMDFCRSADLNNLAVEKAPACLVFSFSKHTDTHTHTHAPTLPLTFETPRDAVNHDVSKGGWVRCDTNRGRSIAPQHDTDAFLSSFFLFAATKMSDGKFFATSKKGPHVVCVCVPLLPSWLMNNEERCCEEAQTSWVVIHLSSSSIDAGGEFPPLERFFIPDTELSALLLSQGRSSSSSKLSTA